MKPNKCLSSQSPIVVVVKFTHSSINLQEDRQQGNAPPKIRVKYVVCLSPIGSINSVLMAQLLLKMLNISHTDSLVKLHYFQFAFLENCVYKKQKKSIRVKGIFVQTHFFKCSPTF